MINENRAIHSKPVIGHSWIRKPAYKACHLCILIVFLYQNTMNKPFRHFIWSLVLEMPYCGVRVYFSENSSDLQMEVNNICHNSGQLILIFKAHFSFHTYWCCLCVEFLSFTWSWLLDNTPDLDHLEQLAHCVLFSRFEALYFQTRLASSK